MHPTITNMAHGLNSFHPNNAASSSSNPYSDLPNGNPSMYNSLSHHQRPPHHQPPSQQMHPPTHSQWNGPMRQNSMSQGPMPPAPQNTPFNQPGWPNINQLHPQQFPNGMPPMGGFNMPFFPHQMMQDSFIVPPPVESAEEKIILQTLVESKNRRESYKDALNSLHGRNGHTASQWKDYYLDHKDRLDETISVYLNPPKVALQAIKKPSPSAYKVEPSPARSLPPPKPKRQDSVQRAPLPTAGKRNTINSLTAPAPVFGDRLPPPNADIQIPDPPSRSPSPPTVIVPHRGRGNKYTPEDRDFFLKFIAWRLKGDPSLTRNDLCAMLAEKAPHHTAQSWGSYWSNKHDVPDKILAAAKGDDYGHEESQSEEEETRTIRRRPKYKELSSEEEDEDDEDKNSQSESDGDDDDDDPIKVYSESEMGQRGGAFTDADLYITAKYTLTCPNFDNVSAKERWEPYSERYPQRSAKSWAEYYRRYEKTITKLARKMKKQGHDLSGKSSSIHKQRAKPSWASQDANDYDSYQAKRKHSVDPDAEGEYDNEHPPSRSKRGRGDEA